MHSSRPASAQGRSPASPCVSQSDQPTSDSPLCVKTLLHWPLSASSPAPAACSSHGYSTSLTTIGRSLAVFLEESTSPTRSHLVLYISNHGNLSLTTGRVVWLVLRKSTLSTKKKGWHFPDLHAFGKLTSTVKFGPTGCEQELSPAPYG